MGHSNKVLIAGSTLEYHNKSGVSLMSLPLSPFLMWHRSSSCGVFVFVNQAGLQMIGIHKQPHKAGEGYAECRSLKIGVQIVEGSSTL